MNDSYGAGGYSTARWTQNRRGKHTLNTIHLTHVYVHQILQISATSYSSEERGFRRKEGSVGRGFRGKKERGSGGRKLKEY